MRSEFKYIVPNDKLDLLRQMISPFVSLDPNAAKTKNKEYTVRSIYFDTPDFRYYAEKLAGIKIRKKVRLRGYDLESLDSRVFFEIKHKIGVPIAKTRAPGTYRNALNLFAGARIEDQLENTDKFPGALDAARRFFFHIHKLNLQPVVCVIYEREPFVSVLYTKNDMRITLDKNLRGVGFPAIDELYDENRAVSSMPGNFILEIKFNHFFPSFMRPILSTLGLQKEPASKYVICIDSLKMLPYRSNAYTRARSTWFKKASTKELLNIDSQQSLS